jgi:hypothetical protein
MTSKAHWNRKVKRLKRTLTYVGLLGFCAAVWVAVGWVCWTVASKFSP